MRQHPSTLPNSPRLQGKAWLVGAAVVAHVARAARLLQEPLHPLHQDDQENREHTWNEANGVLSMLVVLYNHV